jgi:hypothetical protein
MSYSSGEIRTALGLHPNSFMEAMWETLITLAVAAGISISLISLSAHLNEVKKVRESVALATMQSGAPWGLSSGSAVGAAQPATNFN